MTTYGAITGCQTCNHSTLTPVLSLGYLPPVNTMRVIGNPAISEPWFPAEVFQCPKCHLVQLGFAADPNVLFPPEYPYTSGTTKILRENFADLARESTERLQLPAGALVVDVGSNDGTLLKPFKELGMKVRGVEPSLTAELAEAAGIPTFMRFFNNEAATAVVAADGKASLVTAANVFAHIHGIHDIIEAIASMLDTNGVFISESHYLPTLIEGLQYDTVYHEHLRYYSLTSLQELLRMHGFTVFHARLIPTHGGSIRVYASKDGRPASAGVADILEAEKKYLGDAWIAPFRKRVVDSKLALYEQIAALKKQGKRIVAIGAPSRAATLVNYVGLDEGMIECVYEVPGSKKVGKYMPGRMIPVLAETGLVQDPQPDIALLLSWHIAEELMVNLRKRGFKGQFLIPLPEPRVVT